MDLYLHIYKIRSQVAKWSWTFSAECKKDSSGSAEKHGLIKRDNAIRREGFSEVSCKRVCSLPPQRFFNYCATVNSEGASERKAVCVYRNLNPILSELYQGCGVTQRFVPFAATPPALQRKAVVPDAFIEPAVCIVADKTWMHTPEALAKHYISYNAKVCFFFSLWKMEAGFSNVSKLKWRIKTKSDLLCTPFVPVGSFSVWPIAPTPGVPLNIFARCSRASLLCVIFFSAFFHRDVHFFFRVLFSRQKVPKC